VKTENVAPSVARGAILILSVFLLSCSDLGNGPDNGPRSFVLGFTDFPYARSLAAVQEVRRIVAEEGDLAVFHFDGGVPWQEAAAGTSYNATFESELTAQKAAVPAGHKIYLALTPINLERNGLARHRGAGTDEPLIAPFDTLGFGDSLVIRSFTAYCLRMIDQFEPDYFGYAIEANLVARNDPALQAGLLLLAESVYVAVKRAHPSLPVFSTIQLENLYSGLPANGTVTTELMEFSDVLALSTYPYTVTADPRSIPRKYFLDLDEIADGKRIAVAETGWPAEPITAPYPVPIFATAEFQVAYIERLLGDMNEMDALFVNWFFTRDYDDLWEAELKDLPGAPLFRLWKDVGLYAGDGTERPALVRWRRWVGYEYQGDR
jgi:hypothetical protein